MIGMTKVKMSKEDETSVQSEFVEKRRAALERYLNRTATHPNLRQVSIKKITSELPNKWQDCCWQLGC